MNAAVIQTSDDEFGYDFETDDEELLIQLASNHSPPLKQSTDPLALGPAPSTAKKTISSFEVSRDVKTFHEHVYPRNGLALGPVKKLESPTPTATTRSTDQKPILSTPSTTHDPVVYPDCEYGFNIVILD
jgi:exonuclease V